MNLSQRIKELRYKQDISLDEISKKCGVGKATLSRIENGKCSPSIKTLHKISQALGIDVRELLAVVEFE